MNGIRAAALPPLLSRMVPPALFWVSLLALFALLNEWVSLSPPRQRMSACAFTIIAYAAFCGWVYVRRRAERLAMLPVADNAPLAGGRSPVLVAFASQTGFAEQIAARTARALQAAGMPVRLEPLGRLSVADLQGVQQALFVVSTTGEGDAPDSAARFARQVMGVATALPELSYGVLALGDSSYDNYCAFGRELESWLHHQGAVPLFDTVRVDNGDEGALRHWQHYLGVVSGSSEVMDWTTPHYQTWQLAERVELNAGSPGAPAFHIALAAAQASHAWQAGDIAEIGPRNAADQVARWLDLLKVPADAQVQWQGAATRFADVLSRALLPHDGAVPDAWRPMDAQALADVLRPLPHREYSIASLPADGRLELLVRQASHPGGSLGIGSGWLTRHAAVGADIALRIRQNRGFHAPLTDRPMILVGNGTGLAGLRAHIKARAAAGRHRNWLLFGERTQAFDFFHRAEIQAWQAQGVLARVDLAFSRDSGSSRYVQDCLAQAEDELRSWVADGAAIYVCGSLQGMAGGVAAVLERVLGLDALERMAEERAYRRDVY